MTDARDPLARPALDVPPRVKMTYPDDDLAARRVDGRLVFTRKDGTPY